MKKTTVGIAIVILLAIVGLVGVYAYLSGRVKTEVAETVMTPVQLALSRDLKNDYPATVKEVIKYYTDIEKCFYNEDCTEEEIEQLGRQARELYDDELQEANEIGIYLNRLKADILSFKTAKKRISSISVAASTSVDFFQQDGYEFARIRCGYLVRDAKGKSYTDVRTYLLRRDAKRRWKIYGWEEASKSAGGDQ